VVRGRTIDLMPILTPMAKHWSEAMDLLGDRYQT